MASDDVQAISTTAAFAPAVSAPAAALTEGELVLDFVNTRSVLGSPDHLRDAEAMRAWTGERGLIEPGTLISDADVTAAREIRAALATLLLAHVSAHGSTHGSAHGSTHDQDEQDERDEQAIAIAQAEAYLARAATLHPVAPVISVHSSRWAALQTGVAGFFGTLLAAAAQTASTSEWKRMKACKNHACYTGFLDKTKNSSALYCSTSCSSQVASRAYRKRHAAAGQHLPAASERGS